MPKIRATSQPFVRRDQSFLEERLYRKYGKPFSGTIMFLVPLKPVKRSTQSTVKYTDINTHVKGNNILPCYNGRNRSRSSKICVSCSVMEPVGISSAHCGHIQSIAYGLVANGTPEPRSFKLVITGLAKFIKVLPSHAIKEKEGYQRHWRSLGTWKFRRNASWLLLGTFL